MTERLIDGTTLRKTINCGENYELDDAERKALAEHSMGIKTNILKENFFVHRNGLVITKLLAKDLDIEECLKVLLHSCGFDKRVKLGNEIKALSINQ